MQKYRILITCPKGIPPFLKQELLSLDLPVLAENIAGVETEGSFDDVLRLNLSIRTGHRVLLLLKEFLARTADDLYRQVTAIGWETLIPEDGYLCVTSSVDTPGINDVRYATLVCKDAVVDRIKEKIGKRPNSGQDRNHTVVHLYWKKERGNVYLDTSGEPLSRRGYRKIPLVAPMQETLAAAVVRATGWDGSRVFVNPMCGSGTLAIEAALMGLNHAPGLLRRNFGFMHVKRFNESDWDVLCEKARQEAKESFSGRIIATDINPGAVEAARKNAAAAGVEHLIEFSACHFADTPLTADGGIIVMNPEYGERMGEIKKLEITYKEIGDFLKHRCRGYTGYLFTGSSGLAKKVSLKPKQSWQFYNSTIECRLLAYDLYEGSRKIKKHKAQVSP